MQISLVKAFFKLLIILCLIACECVIKTSVSYTQKRTDGQFHRFTLDYRGIQVVEFSCSSSS